MVATYDPTCSPGNLQKEAPCCFSYVPFVTFRKVPEKDQGLSFSLGHLTLVRVRYVNCCNIKVPFSVPDGGPCFALAFRGWGPLLVALSSSGFSESFPLSWWVCIRGPWMGGLFHSDFVVSILQTVPPSKRRQRTKLFLAGVVHPVLLCQDFWHNPSSVDLFPAALLFWKLLRLFIVITKLMMGPIKLSLGWASYDTEMLTYFISNDQLFSLV